MVEFYIKIKRSFNNFHDVVVCGLVEISHELRCAVPA